MTAIVQKIDRQVKQHWSYIHKFFVYSDGTPMTQKQAIACLWAEFHAKTRNLTNPVILTAELEILDPMPYEATVYRKDKGQWQRLKVEGMTPLTVCGRGRAAAHRGGRGVVALLALLPRGA
jgi:hypothetical protein